MNGNNFLETELDWTPLTSTGSNFTTHRIHFYKPHEMRSSKTLLYKFFLIVFFIAGLCLLFFTTFGDPVYRNGAAPFSGEDNWGDILCYFLGIAFTLVGVNLVVEKRLIINKLKNSLSTGEKSSTNETIEWPLDEIIAIQLLSKNNKDSDGDYLSFELNAVFKNHERINLISHGGKSSITKDASKIAKFLGKPLFNRA